MTSRPISAPSLTFHLPRWISGWNLYEGHGKNKRLSREYRAWIREMDLSLMADRVKLRPLAPPYTLNVEYPVTDNPSYDLSNTIKGTEDYLVKRGVMKDDKFVDHLHLDRVRAPQETGVVVTVRSLAEISEAAE